MYFDTYVSFYADYTIADSLCKELLLKNTRKIMHISAFGGQGLLIKMSKIVD